MLFYLFSQLFLELYWIAPYLPYFLFVGVCARFINDVCWIKGIVLLCYAALICLVRLLVTGPFSYLYSMAAGSVQSEEAEAAPPGYFGSHLVGVVWNYTCCFVPGSQAAGGTSVYSFPHLTKLISTAFENFEYPFYTPTTMFMVTSLLQLSQILILMKFKQFFKSIMAPPIPATDTVATQTSASSTKEKPKNQSSTPVSVAPVHKKYTKKSVRIVKDDDEPGPSHDQGDAEGEVVTRSLSLSELRDMRKDFSRNQGEQLVTWLLRCWDRGALPPARRRRGTTEFIGLYGFNGLAHQTHESIRL